MALEEEQHDASPDPYSDLEKVESWQDEEIHRHHRYDGYSDHSMGVPLSPVPTNRSRSRSRPRSILSRTATATTTSGKKKFNFPPAARTKTGPDVIVDFDGPDDPYRPINWPIRKKILTTIIYSTITMGSSWNSSIYSSATDAVSAQFGVAQVVSTLGITLFLFGFGTGPLFWGPLSELYGRKISVLPPYFISICFTFGSATSKDLQTLLITRFFAGFFGAAPVTNSGGVLSDIWAPQERGNALAVYSLAVLGGPLLAPVVGGAIYDSYLSWRWIFYVTGILLSAIFVFAFFFAEETYPNALLVYKARRLRHESGNWALHAKHEEWDVSISELAHKYLIRPFRILSTPIGACMATYASFVYAIIYLCLAAFPIEFITTRHWNHLVGSLPFIGTLLGALLGAYGNTLNNKYYFNCVKANGGRPVPEARLPPMMAGAIVFPAGCFLFGWTSSPHVFWFCPVIGTFMIGFGFCSIFQGALNYLIDTFQLYAASAVAGNTALRSLLAGVFPLFTAPMFHNLGIPWASSLIGFLAVAMAPIPFLFFVFGKRLRALNEWSRPSV